MGTYGNCTGTLMTLGNLDLSSYFITCHLLVVDPDHGLSDQSQGSLATLSPPSFSCQKLWQHPGSNKQTTCWTTCWSSKHQQLIKQQKQWTLRIFHISGHRCWHSAADAEKHLHKSLRIIYYDLFLCCNSLWRSWSIPVKLQVPFQKQELGTST